MGERFMVEAFFGEQDVFLPGSPTLADILSAVRPTCPVCRRAIEASDLVNISKLVG